MLADRKKNSDVVLIASSDWHLSLNAPLARAEKGHNNWKLIQARVLQQLGALQREHQCPIAVAGDMFDRWDSSAAVINHALANMPGSVIAIPGNHDTPYHNHCELDKSAYWTMYEAGKMKHLTMGGSHEIGPIAGASLSIFPFPAYNATIEQTKADTPAAQVKPNNEDSLCLKIALIHDCIWTATTGYTGADEGKRYAKWLPKLKGYDIAIFGDNHHGFLIQANDKVSILNTGTLLRRKATEIDYKPSVGLIHANGKITRHFLDISKDEFSDMGKQIAKIEASLKVDLGKFMEELQAAQAMGLDWKAIVKAYCDKNKLDKSVRDFMISTTEKGK